MSAEVTGYRIVKGGAVLIVEFDAIGAHHVIEIFIEEPILGDEVEVAIRILEAYLDELNRIRVSNAEKYVGMILTEVEEIA